MLQFPFPLENAGFEKGGEVEKSVPGHTQRKVAPLAWNLCEGLPSVEGPPENI